MRPASWQMRRSAQRIIIIRQMVFIKIYVKAINSHV